MKANTFLKSEDLFIRPDAEGFKHRIENKSEDKDSQLKFYLDFYGKIKLTAMRDFLEFLGLYEKLFQEAQESSDTKAKSHIATLRANIFSSDTWTHRHPDKAWYRLRLTRYRKSTEELQKVLESQPYFVLQYLLRQAKKEVARKKRWMQRTNFRNRHEKALIYYQNILSILDSFYDRIEKEKRRTEEDLFYRFEIATQMLLPTCEDVMFYQMMTHLTEDRFQRAHATGLTTDSLKEAQKILAYEFLSLPSQFSRNMSPAKYAKILATLIKTKNSTIKERLSALPLFDESLGSLKTENRWRKNHVSVIPAELSAFIPKRLYLPKAIVRIFFKDTYERYTLFENTQWLLLVMKTSASIIHFLKAHKNAKLYIEEIMVFFEAELKSLQKRLNEKAITPKNKQCLEKWHSLLLKTQHQFVMALEGTFPQDNPSISEALIETPKLSQKDLQEREDFHTLQTFGLSCPIPLRRIKALTTVFREKIALEKEPIFSIYQAEEIFTTLSKAVQKTLNNVGITPLRFEEQIEWLREYGKLYTALPSSLLKSKAEILQAQIQSIFTQALLHFLEPAIAHVLEALKTLIKFPADENAQNKIYLCKAPIAACIDLMKEFPWHGLTKIAPDLFYKKLHSHELKWPTLHTYAQALYEGIKIERSAEKLSQNRSSLFQKPADPSDKSNPQITITLGSL